MMCGKYLSSRRRSCWRWLVLSAALTCSIAPAIAQESQTSGPPGISASTTPEQLPLSGSATLIETWPDYDTASASFLSALDQLALSWPKYSRLQVSLGISFSDFPEYIDGLIAQSEASEAALTKERADRALQEAADKKALEDAERSRDAWRTGALYFAGSTEGMITGLVGGVFVVIGLIAAFFK